MNLIHLFSYFKTTYVEIEAVDISRNSIELDVIRFALPVYYVILYVD